MTTMSSPSNNSLLSKTWTIFVAITLWYAPLAFDYFFPYQFGRSFYNANATLSAWEQHFAQLTSSDYALGKGSIREYFEDQFQRQDTRLAMWIHATTGAATLTLMTLQFIPPLRQRYPTLHRTSGYAAFVLEIFMLASSAHHLCKQGADHFGGKDFAVGLWVMWAFAAIAMAMSFLHIAVPRYRNIYRHSAWAALNYGTLNSAPGLRLFWWAFHACGFEGTLADCNASAALWDFVAVGVGVFCYITCSQPIGALEPKSFETAKAKLVFVATTLFSSIGVVGLAQQMLGWYPNLQLWGDYSAELSLAQSVPLAAGAALGGLVGSLLVAPVYVYQTLSEPHSSTGTLRALLYTCFAVCTAGLFHYVPAVSPALHNTWTSFYVALVVLQWFGLTMEVTSSSVGARQIWAMMQWITLCMPAFTFAVWPLFPLLSDFSRVEAYNAAIEVSLVPVVPVFLAALYLPKVALIQRKTIS